jgi:hypothetical protein
MINFYLSINHGRVNSNHFRIEDKAAEYSQTPLDPYHLSDTDLSIISARLRYCERSGTYPRISSQINPSVTYSASVLPKIFQG